MVCFIRGEPRKNNMGLLKIMCEWMNIASEASMAPENFWFWLLLHSLIPWNQHVLFNTRYVSIMNFHVWKGLRTKNFYLPSSDKFIKIFFFLQLICRGHIDFKTYRILVTNTVKFIIFGTRQNIFQCELNIHDNTSTAYTLLPSHLTDRKALEEKYWIDPNGSTNYDAPYLSVQKC